MDSSPDKVICDPNSYIFKKKRLKKLSSPVFRLPTSDFRLPTSDFRLPTSDNIFYPLY
jgi:hypothetical protein